MTLDQLDLFIATAGDIAPKEQQDLMSRCWFSLAKQKRTTPIEHRFGDDWVKVSGNKDLGIATIFDNDVLLYVIAQYMFALNHGKPCARRFHFTGYDYYTFVGKKRLSGRGYSDLWNSLQRLHHTFVETNIRMGVSKRHHSFNWLSEIKQTSTGNTSRGYEIVIPEWLYESVVELKNVLTLNSEYFGIKGGLERFLYLFARKSAGKQTSGWEEWLPNLYAKSASLGTYAEFRRNVYKIVDKGKFLDYRIDTIHTQRKEGLRFTIDKQRKGK